MGSVNPENAKLGRPTGIIAGRGPLPLKIARLLKARGQPPFILLIRDEANPADFGDFDCEIVNIAKVGKILNRLTERHCHDLVLAGPVARPNFRHLLPDFEGLKLIKRFKSAKQLGDNTLLSIITDFLAEKGFNVIGAHEFDSELTVQPGILSKMTPTEAEYDDISKATQILAEIGRLDIGQSMVYCDGYVLAVEAAEGTDQMIARCRQFQKDEAAGFLIKMPKPGQNLAVDMPTIGVDTVISTAEAGLRGIVFEAENTLLLDPAEIVEEADRRKIFLCAISPEIS